jgi:hypothetical protein
LVSSPKRHEFSGKELLDLFEITKDDFELFEKMDSHFQVNYILNNNHYPLYMLYNKFGEKRIGAYEHLSNLDERMNDLHKNVYPIQVYYDTGSGFSEEESKVYWTDMTESNEGTIEVDITPEVLAIRVDPVDKPCVVNVLEFEGNDNVMESMNYHTNACYKLSDNYIFDTDDPQFLININSKENKKIKIILRIEPFSIETRDWLNTYLNNEDFSRNVFKQTEEKNRQLEEKNRQIIEKNNEIEEKRHLLAIENEKYLVQLAINEELLDSTSWKITRPLRWVREKIISTKET